MKTPLQRFRSRTMRVEIALVERQFEALQKSAKRHGVRYGVRAKAIILEALQREESGNVDATAVESD